MSNEKQELYNEIKKCKLIVFSDIHYLDKRPNNIDWVLSRKLTQYADELLAHTEETLTKTLAGLEKNISEALKLMEISVEDTLKTVQNSRKELN